MDLGLQEKRVLVTGATRGIGLATAKLFAEEGARVAITYSTSAAAAEHAVSRMLGGADRALAVQYELREPETIETAMRTVEERFGGIDVLVANALWFTWSGPDVGPDFEDVPTEAWMIRFRANTEAHMLTAQRAVRGMRERGWGRIVLVSSITAHYGMPKSEIYSSSKAALHGFARGLMWTRKGVLVNVVAPGLTMTESVHEMAKDPANDDAFKQEVDKTPSGRLSDPIDIARLIVFLGSEANGNVNGQVIHTAGGR